jgi:hypothetical protein
MDTGWVLYGTVLIIGVLLTFDGLRCSSRLLIAVEPKEALHLFVVRARVPPTRPCGGAAAAAAAGELIVS